MLCFYTNVADKNLVFQNGLLGMLKWSARAQTCSSSKTKLPDQILISGLLEKKN